MAPLDDGVATAATGKASRASKAPMDSLVPPDRERFEHIARVQEERESEARHRSRHQRLSLSLSQHSDRRSNDERRQAARVAETTCRGHEPARGMEGVGLDASTRWVAAIREAQFRQSTKPRAAPGADGGGGDGGGHPTLDDAIDTRPSDARRKWKKASLVMRHAGHDDGGGADDDGADDDSDSAATSASSGRRAPSPGQRAEARRRRAQANAERRRRARMMGLQYFLEMVDVKHRYGSNLRMYHEEWKRSDTTDNFFYWLDYGDGRRVELAACPRERLEREQVRYLSREERQYYLATVDADGRLCWAKSGERIDTTERYKDSIRGIVPADDPTPAFSPRRSPSQAAASAAASAAATATAAEEDEDEDEDERESDRAAKYANAGLDEEHGLKKVTHVSASTIFNKLMRKSVRKNTWIFVADTSFRLYVGIKDSGMFQHSSFLQGGRVSAAGLIKIKKGRLSSLSPLSGHYRPPAANFRAFVHSLKGAGVDMSHVSISKSYAVLVGLETYVKTRRKGKALVARLARRRDKMVAPGEFRRREEERRDKSESAEKERRFLESQRRDGGVAGRLKSMSRRGTRCG